MHSTVMLNDSEASQPFGAPTLREATLTLPLRMT